MSAPAPSPRPAREERDALRTRYGAATRFRSRVRERTAPVPPGRVTAARPGDRPEAAPPA